MLSCCMFASFVYPFAHETVVCYESSTGDGQVKPDKELDEEYDEDWNVKLEADENIIYQVRYIVLDER